MRKLLLTTALTTSLTAGLTALAASAAGAQADDPYAYPNGARVSLTGEVAAIAGDTLSLDYGDGQILVELDDQDAFNEAALAEEGERITVNGLIDDDFLELHSIEADSIFFHDTGTLYQDVSYADEEGGIDVAVLTAGYAYPMPADGSYLSLVGAVEDIEDNDFVLDLGFWRLQVDTDRMEGFNPASLHDVTERRANERQVIEEGDFVRVTGEFDEGVMERDELHAQSIVRVYDASENRARDTAPDASE